eukprot:365626-Chlamydomonas_euryale.AAC.5
MCHTDTVASSATLATSSLRARRACRHTSVGYSGGARQVRRTLKHICCGNAPLEVWVTSGSHMAVFLAHWRTCRPALRTRVRDA